MSSWNPSTFWQNSSEMSTVEFTPDTKADDSFLRQRYRKHSLAPSSPTVLKQIRRENGQRTSLWRQLGWLLLALVIILPAVHYFFKDSFKPYRYRTHRGYLSKFEFLSQFLPEKYHAPLEDFSGVSIITAEPDIPLYAPFDNIDVENQDHDRQLINSTVSQLRRIEIKFRNTTREMTDLANLRNDHIKVAKVALNTLRVAAETGNGDKGANVEELKKDTQAIIEALTNVEKHSDKYEAYRQIIPKDVHSIIRNGTEKQSPYAELRGDEAKFRVYCKALEYQKTLDELTREFKILLKTTEELSEAVTSLAKTSLSTCKHAYLIESPTLDKDENYACDDAWMVVWNAFRPRPTGKLNGFKEAFSSSLGVGPEGLQNLMQVDATKVSAGEASEALTEKMTSIMEDINVLHKGMIGWQDATVGFLSHCSNYL